LCIVYCVLCIVYCVLCIVYCVLCIVYCVLCIVYCVLCIVFQTAQENNFCHSGIHTDWILLSSSHVEYPSNL